MIEFRGELSKNCKQYLIKKESYSCFIILIGSLFLSIPVIILTICVDWIWILCLLPLLVLSIASLFPPKGKVLDKIFPTKVIILDGMIYSEGKDFRISNQTSNIKKILDYGEFYHIIFKFPYKSLRYLCEKSLIVEGTLSEFEEKFKDHIVRKEM